MRSRVGPLDDRCSIWRSRCRLTETIGSRTSEGQRRRLGLPTRFRSTPIPLASSSTRNAPQLSWMERNSSSSRSYPGAITLPSRTAPAGSAAMALATRSFRWEGFASIEDLVNHIAGGVLMGFGGVTALGCTIGQGLTGISTLAIGSVIAFLAIVAGCAAALKYQYWRAA